MEPPGGRDSRFNLGYSMNLLSGETPPEIYSNPNLGRPSTSLQQLSPRHTMVSSVCNRGIKSDLYDDRGMSSQGMGLDSCVSDLSEDTYSMQSKKSPPSNGKKTKGRVKIKMEYIENKLRRYTTFSKRKTGIMKKAYELSTLTGTQVMLLVASETGHVYTFATRKLQPMITSEAGKALIQTCLNSPDPPAGAASGGDQRMSATGFEETELTYNISDDDSKDAESGSSSSEEEIDTPEDNSVYPEKIIPYQHQKVLRPQVLEKCPTKEPPSGPTTRVESLIAQMDEETRIAQYSKSVFPPPTTIDPLITLPSQKSCDTLLPMATIMSSTTSPSALLMTSNSVAVSSSSTTGSRSSPLQAVPLLMQTPNGMSYVSTPDGMLLGLLQGPNISQPQLVAIPLDRLGDLSGSSREDLVSGSRKDQRVKRQAIEK